MEAIILLITGIVSLFMIVGFFALTSRVYKIMKMFEENNKMLNEHLLHTKKLLKVTEEGQRALAANNQDMETFEVSQNGEQIGALTLADIRKRMIGGQLRETDYYKDNITGEWMALDGLAR